VLTYAAAVRFAINIGIASQDGWPARLWSALSGDMHGSASGSHFDTTLLVDNRVPRR
jgi:hypothetical protein